MKEKKAVIDEKTFISLRVLILAIAFAMWLTRLSDRIESSERAIVELQKLCSTVENGH